MMETRKWWQSKKFWMAMVGAIVPAVNEYFKLGLPTEQVLAVLGLLLGGIFSEAALDAHRANKTAQVATAALPPAHPIQYPMIREIVDSLVTDHYFYNQAKADGLSTHAAYVWDKVVEGLRQFLTPQVVEQVLADNTIRDEVMRQVFKKYNQDVSLMDGAKISSGGA